MEVTPRVTPELARARVQSGEALLVCAYDDDEKFRALRLERAISLRQFREVEPSLSGDQEIIFYCAWPKEATSAGLAARYIEMGFKNAKALKGGVEGWKEAGFRLI